MPRTINGHALTEEQKRKYDSLTPARRRVVDRNIADYDSRHGGLSQGKAFDQRNAAINAFLRVTPSMVDKFRSKNLSSNYYGGTLPSTRSVGNKVPANRSTDVSNYDDYSLGKRNVRNRGDNRIYDGGTLVGPTIIGKRRKKPTNNASNTAIRDTPAKSNTPASHTIRRGETLGQIAKKYGVDYRQLAKDNGISDPNMIIAGRKLNINQPTKTPKKKAVRKARTPLVQQVPLPPVTRQQVWDQANASLPNIDDILGL